MALVERFTVGSQTTSRGAGQTQQVRFDDATSRLAIRSLDLLGRFPAETGEPLRLWRTGSLKLALSSPAARQIGDEVVRGRALGVEIDEIAPIDVRDLAPHVNPARVVAAWWSPADVHFRGVQLATGYARSLRRRLGGRILERTSVVAITVRGDRVVAVETSRGRISTPVVINAAGAWAAEVGAMVGIRLPIVAILHQLALIEPARPLPVRAPIVRVVDTNGYVRREGRRVLVSGSMDDPVAIDPTALPDGLASLRAAHGPMLDVMRRLAPEFPVLAGAGIREIRCGLPTMTPDGLHVFDRIEAVGGMCVLCGCVRGGVSVAPAVGEAMAGWIDSGKAPGSLASYRLSRFPATLGDSALEEASLGRYRHHYEAPP